MAAVVGTGSYDGALSLGVIGGGQLARMLAEAASPLGIRLFAVVEDAAGSAAQVLPTAIVGQADDAAAILDVASSVAALTVEHEHVGSDLLEKCAAVTAVRPSAGALEFAKNKHAMRTLMDAIGVPGPRWVHLTPDTVEEALASWDLSRSVLKLVEHGYDGKGVRVNPDDATCREWAALEGGALLEERIDFVAEVAQLCVRSPGHGDVIYPLVETVQRGGMCREVYAPPRMVEGDLQARESLEARAGAIARQIAEAADVYGVLAVEMFVTGNGQLLVNELAMRPHNSGHWSIEGARTSQFENHLRAVAGMPLGSCEMTAPAVVMVNVVGGDGVPDPRYRMAQALAAYPDVHLHLYGKATKPGRKIGHVTAVGPTLEAAGAAARGAAAILNGEASV